MRKKGREKSRGEQKSVVVHTLVLELVLFQAVWGDFEREVYVTVRETTNYKAPLEGFKLALQTHKRRVERLDGVRVGRGLHAHKHHILERVRDLVARKHHVGVAHQLAVVQNTLAAFAVLDLLTVRYGTLGQK